MRKSAQAGRRDWWTPLWLLWACRRSRAIKLACGRAKRRSGPNQLEGVLLPGRCETRACKACAFTTPASCRVVTEKGPLLKRLMGANPRRLSFFPVLGINPTFSDRTQGVVEGSGGAIVANQSETRSRKHLVLRSSIIVSLASGSALVSQRTVSQACGTVVV